MTLWQTGIRGPRQDTWGWALGILLTVMVASQTGLVLPSIIMAGQTNASTEPLDFDVSFTNPAGLSDTELQSILSQTARYYQPLHLRFHPLGDHPALPWNLNFVDSPLRESTGERGGVAIAGRGWIFVDPLCRVTPRQFDQDTLIAATAAHELAHELGLRHSRSGIMAEKFYRNRRPYAGFSKQERAAILAAIRKQRAAQAGGQQDPIRLRAVLTGDETSAQGPAGNLTITLRVYNYAQVSSDILTQAEVAAAEILGKAGVQIAWTNCDPARRDLGDAAGCNQFLGPTNLGVRILPYFGVLPGATRRTMGFAVGYLASVSVRRVKEEAAEFGVQPYEVLGPAIAHEIGHLLLGQQGHSLTGIMRARWRREDYERAPLVAFRLTAEQAEQMRVEVSRRVQEQGAAEVATATATR